MKKTIQSLQTGAQPLAILDIGSSKIACFIAKTNADDAIEIIGIGHQLAEGIKAGNIVDMHAAERSISAAVSAAEKMAGVNIDRISVSVTGKGVESSFLKEELLLAGREIYQSDVLDLMRLAQTHSVDGERILVHCLPLEYALDGNQNIQNPCAMVGDHLEAVFHMVTTSKLSVQNLIRCLGNCHLDVEAFVSNPYAAGLACLTEDDMKLGALVLDIGAGQTSFSVFKNDEMVYAGSIPIGGMHVTNDIALGLETNLANAERIKTLYGSVISSVRDEQELIDVVQKDGHREEVVHVQRATLTKIIHARIEEMFELIRQQLKSKEFDHIVGRLIVVGGTSQLAGVRQFAGHVFGKRAVRSVPEALKGSAESTSGPAFAAPIGMLHYMKRQRELQRSGLVLPQKPGLKRTVMRVGQWLKENF